MLLNMVSRHCYSMANDAFLNVTAIDRSIDCIDFVVASLATSLTVVKHWFILLFQRILMILSVLTFFSGVRIEVGKYCNSLTEVPCC